MDTKFMNSENVNLEEQKCPSCGYRLGKPIDGKAKRIEINKPSDPVFAFCVRCLAPLMVDPGISARLATYKELYSITLIKPQEVLRMMDISLHLNANLPRIDAEKN